MAVGQVIADRYELKETVGTGGMSTVYCAFDTLLERNVALKILHEHYGGDAEYVERFRREARAVAQLSHPNIVTVIDRGEEDGRQFIVFELVDGENLKELVERGGPLPVRRVLELGLEVGRALAFAHAQGLIHRDVKPQNVLLNGDGRAKVTDFGIARSLDAVGQTETGTVLGTSHYIAPEQARGERVDAQTDVYSFGVVLYELLTGEVPYTGDNFLSVAMKHVNEPVPSVLDTPSRRADPARVAGRALPREGARRPARVDGRGRRRARGRAGRARRQGGRRGDDDHAQPAARRRAPPQQSARARRGPPLAALAAVLARAAARSRPRSAAILLADAGRRRRRAATAERRRRSRCRASPRTTRTATTSEHTRARRGRDRRRTRRPTGRRRATGDFSKPGVGLVLEGRRRAGER